LLCRKTGRRYLVPLFLALALAPSTARAAELKLIPSISQELRYDDNVFVSSSRQTHDFSSYTLGGLQLLDRTERLDLNATLQGAQSLYNSNTSLNSTDLLTNGAIRYTFTPKLALSGRASYTRDSQPDRELQTTGLVLSGVRRERYTFGATSDYQLTEKTLASLSYDHEADHYGGGTGNSTLSNLASDAGTFTVQHDLTRLVPNTTGLVNLGYTGYSLTGVDVKNYQATTGFRYALQEKWSVQVAAGLRRTESSFTTFIPTGFFFGPFFVQTGFVEEKTSSSGWGGVGQASLDFKGDVTTATFSAFRDIAAASGQNGTVERTSFTFSGARRFTYEFQGTFSASYFINKSGGGELSSTPLDFRTFNISPGVRYEFNRDMFLEGSYTFTRVEDKQTDASANRNLFLVRFFVQHAVLE
jgi:hypothetical protein